MSTSDSIWAVRAGLSVATVGYLLSSHDALLGGTTLHAFWFALGVALIVGLVQTSRAYPHGWPVETAGGQAGEAIKKYKMT
jgi:hypothetical protein